MSEDRCYHLVDALRGLALVNMLAYHFLYDVNVVYGRDPEFYLHPWAHIWQQFICLSFILIAGLSFRWGSRHNLRRGLFLNACGLVITMVTLLVMPDEVIWFGILNFMGCAVLLTIPLAKGLKKLSPAVGLAVCFALFLILKRVESGVKEVMLLGQNVNSYGLDRAGEMSFAELLAAADETGIPRIRFMTSHPKDFSLDMEAAGEPVPLSRARPAGLSRSRLSLQRLLSHAAVVPAVSVRLVSGQAP